MKNEIIINGELQDKMNFLTKFPNNEKQKNDEIENQKYAELCEACYEQNLDKIKQLLESGVKPSNPQWEAINETSCFNELFRSVFQESTNNSKEISEEEHFLEIIKLLDIYGADFKGREIKDELLHQAVRKNYFKVATYLIDEKKLNINAREEEFKTTPLHTAAGIKNLEMARFLLKKGSDPTLRHQYGSTPAEYVLSCLTESDKILKKLLEEKEAEFRPKKEKLFSNPNAELSEAEKWDRFIEFYAACSKVKTSQQIQKLLNECPTAYNSVIEKAEGLSCLEELIRSTKLNQEIEIMPLIKLIHKLGADLNFKTLSGTLLSSAICHSKVEIAAYLIDKKGIDINAQDNDGNTLLHSLLKDSTIYEQKTFIDLYLKLGADPTIENSEGLTAIQLAEDETIFKKLEDAKIKNKFKQEKCLTEKEIQIEEKNSPLNINQKKLSYTIISKINTVMSKMSKWNKFSIFKTKTHDDKHKNNQNSEQEQNITTYASLQMEGKYKSD